MDSRYRVAKLWAIFCESDGGTPSLLLHAPVWLVSFVHWSLQQQPHETQQQGQRDGATVQKKKLPSVEFSARHRSGPAEAGWAMQAVSAAAAAVDLSRDAGHRRPSRLAKFEASSLGGLREDCDGEIRLLDFSVSHCSSFCCGYSCCH